jgi:hypothetical protein
MPARACAPVSPPGERVRIATESALIVWDDKTRTEHFIRRASFETKVPYFGFLVPTPARPELAEAPDELFQHLEDWTKPEKQTKVVFEGINIGCGGATTRMSGGVEVLAEQHVAGYNAAVLKADDVQALRDWLEQHGYDARPQLTQWLEPYIKEGWIVTAFQIAKTDKEQQSLSTQAVRMSFRTDKPFFPYREPSDQGEGERRERLLRLFVLSGQRMQGEFDEPGRRWPGQAVWANPLAADQQQTLAGLLDPGKVPVAEGAWLTVFDDESAPRSSRADLFFSPAAEQATLRRPPVYAYWRIPFELSCVLFVVIPGIGLWLLVRRMDRRRTARMPVPRR